MEFLIILILILLGIIIPVKIFKPTFVFLAGIASLWGTITLPYIVTISGETITYAVLDSLLQWALGLMLIVAAIVLYLDGIDSKKGDDQ
jgi:hypothetical protein